MNARRLLCALVLGLLYPVHASIITTINRNDPLPVFSTDTPFARLGTSHFEFLKGQARYDHVDHIGIEVLPFYQRANRGTDANGVSVDNLGDINGRWNMMAILPFNPAPADPIADAPVLARHYTGCDIPQSSVPIPMLLTVRDNWMGAVCNYMYNTVNPAAWTACPQEFKTVEGFLGVQQMKAPSNPTVTPDTAQNNLAYWSVPSVYKKYGVRFDVQAYLLGGFGLEAMFGAATIQQGANLVDTTPNASARDPFDTSRVSLAQWATVVQLTDDYLMAQRDNCLRAMDLSACKYQCSSAEDVHLEAFWRWPIAANDDDETDEYAKFLFIPFVRGGGSLFWGKQTDPSMLFALPIGNNGHDSWYMAAGFSLNFYETVQLSFEAGGTFFNALNHCNVPVPTNGWQNGLYPYRANLCVKPGNNWHVVLGMYAPYFLDRFSCNIDYIYVTHARDKMTLLTPNICAGGAVACPDSCAPYRPCMLECMTPWTVQVLNTSITCDLSPHFKVGGLIQIPLRRRNAYRSATYALSASVLF